jgi:hypothetical protein
MRREYCILIVICPDGSRTLFLDAMLRDRKDINKIKKVLDEALHNANSRTPIGRIKKYDANTQANCFSHRVTSLASSNIKMIETISSTSCTWWRDVE